MIINKNLTVNKSQDKISRERKQQKQTIDDHQQVIEDEDNRDEDNNSIYQIMWSSTPCRTKYEYNLGHKAIYNCAILYFTTLMMISSEILKDPKNN